jgi:hypothetical protein
MSERPLSPEGTYENPDTLLRKLTLISQGLALFSTSSEANQEHLVEVILPQLSEELGIILDASQNTWEFLASEKEILKEKLRKTTP